MLVDTLKYVKNLEEVGVPRAQAEVFAQGVAAAVKQRFKSYDHSPDYPASKNDFSMCREEIISLKIELETMRAEIKKLKGEAL